MIKSLLTTTLALLTLASMAQKGFNMTELSVFFPAGQTPGSSQFNDVWGYAAPDGREYGIIGHATGTYFVDVTNPSSPVEIAFEPGGAATIWRDYKTYRHYAFGISDGFGGGSLQVWDLQYLPDSVVKVYDETTISSNAHNIFINNDRLYLISTRRGGTSYPLDIVCIEDPENPYLIGGARNGINIPSPLSTHDAFVRNDTVYLSSAGNGLQVFDFADAENPVFLGSIENYPGKGYNHASWMTTDGTHMIMADETAGSPIKMIDITDLTNIQAVSTFAPDSAANLIPHNPFIKDCLAYISYYHQGVQVYDVTNPSSPVQVGYFDTDTNTVGGFDGCWGVYPYLPSGNILASDQVKGLYVLSFDGSQPACSGNFDKVYEVDTSSYCEDTVTAPVAIEKVNIENVMVYPNPSAGIFHVISEDVVIRKMQLFDIRGVLIEERSMNSYQRETTLDISQNAEGMYILQLFFDQGHKRLKIYKE